MYIEIDSDEDNEVIQDEYWRCSVPDCGVTIKFKFIYNIKRHAFGHDEANYYYSDPTKTNFADRIFFNIIKCPYDDCPRVFFKDNLCEKHCVEEHKVDWIACRVKGCPKLSKDRYSARNHEKTCRYITNPKLSARVYCLEANCPASVSGFTRNADLDRHMRSTHNKRSTKRKSAVMVKDKSGKCISKKRRFNE